jgi:Zn ribbon nucleic-acid-binding protein
MEDGETLPLTCPKCRRPTRKPVRWVQDNTFFDCVECGASSMIDKDEAMKILSARHLPNR